MPVEQRTNLSGTISPGFSSDPLTPKPEYSYFELANEIGHFPNPDVSLAPFQMGDPLSVGIEEWKRLSGAQQWQELVDVVKATRSPKTNEQAQNVLSQIRPDIIAEKDFEFSESELAIFPLVQMEMRMTPSARSQYSQEQLETWEEFHQGIGPEARSAITLWAIKKARGDTFTQMPDVTFADGFILKQSRFDLWSAMEQIRAEREAAMQARGISVVEPVVMEPNLEVSVGVREEMAATA